MRHLAWMLVLAIGCGAPKHGEPVARGRSLERQLESEIVALHQRLRHLEAELQTCDTSGPAPLFAELHQVLSGTEVEVERRGGVIVVSLPIRHLFADPYSLRLREESAMTLDLLATALARHPDTLVRIEGHTDDRMLPTGLVRRYGSHLDLSFQYAAAVLQELTVAFGLAEERFSVTARGAWAPIATNDTPAGQARNQRVEVHVLPAGSR